MKPKPKSEKPAAEPLEIAENQKAASASWKIPMAVLKLAKSLGCPAFKSGRVHRKEMLQWIEDHEAEAADAVAVDIEKADKVELEKEKLRAQVALLKAKLAREENETIPRTEAAEEWQRAVSIIQDEAKQLMDRDMYRVFCDRTKARIGNLHGV